MYLKSLTLKGFKSFASATTLKFEPGITAIVGPNGSGKSNVVDALSWVMGEQGVKSLRGSKMEDVIFAGTSKRAALGRAEVALTIDNSDSRLPIDYTEVTISRTLFRQGGSEYAINGTPCRLLDVQELLSDTGMGREMHVIVGQGQLDQILQAGPEERRGFIEEAAGVLKHRRRKEKAARKLAATQQNLDRLSDLIREIRRQLKPLGRQAEVARRAAVIQAEFRDSRARLLADDLTQAQLALESELAGERAGIEQKAAAEKRLVEAEAIQAASAEALSQLNPKLRAAQENWYALSALRQQVTTTISISAERMRYSGESESAQFGRDPHSLEAEASQVRQDEQALAEQVRIANEKLVEAAKARSAAEAEHEASENSYNRQLRAVADRREGLAKLSGQADSIRARLAAGEEEDARLVARRDAALQQAQRADLAYTKLETTIAATSEKESSLDAEYEQTEAKRLAAKNYLDRLNERYQQASQQLASASARLEALKISLERKDGAAWLLSSMADGLEGEVASLINVESKWQSAVSAALGQVGEALAVKNLDTAIDALGLLKDANAGRAGLILGGAPGRDEVWPKLPQYAIWAKDVIKVKSQFDAGISHLLHLVALVNDLSDARKLVNALPKVTAVTVSGDIVSNWFTAGGSDAKPSLLELQAATEEAAHSRQEATSQVESLKFEISQAVNSLTVADQASADALARLNESDAKMAALAEEINSQAQASRVARADADRAEEALKNARQSRGENQAALAELEERLALASQETVQEPDSSVRDELAVKARLARQSEMDAKLKLRTLEERMRSLAGRADALMAAAKAERISREKAAARAERLRRQAQVAAAVNKGAIWLADQVEQAKIAANDERNEVEAARAEAERRLSQARDQVRQAQKVIDELKEGAHLSEVARVELKMRVEQIVAQAMSELGLDANTLVAEYSPDQMVPVTAAWRPATPSNDEVDSPKTVPYVRSQQEARAKQAAKDLQLLGQVNPLALEEFEAMSERHTFLANQMADLKKTRRDLLDLIEDVDQRVQEVFTEAYQDVAATFEEVFARLFPGGQGKLVLTEPNDMLATGVDVEAKPAGKKVKRLSLLSGGERSLVAVAFLVSLFIARPSPFYILDEVEAALDDVNLSRLLGIYQELRRSSQLLIITHQKRTMEIADALYGVTMRQDGISTVISQRLSDS